MIIVGFVMLIIVNLVYGGLNIGDSCTNTKKCHPFICFNGTCQNCDYNYAVDTTNLCYNLPNDLLYICRNDSSGVATCMTKDFFESFRIRDLLALVIGFICIFFAAVGGLGGGAFSVPIFFIVGGYFFSSTSALSLNVIFGIGCGNLLYFIWMKYSGDPTRQRPKIDYEVALLVVPIVLAGSMIGVLLNRIFPSWLTLIIFLLVVFISSYRTTTKGITLLLDENEDKKKKNEDEKELIELQPIVKEEEKKTEEVKEEEEKKTEEVKEEEEKKEEEKKTEEEVKVDDKKEEEEKPVQEEESVKSEKEEEKLVKEDKKEEVKEEKKSELKKEEKPKENKFLDFFKQIYLNVTTDPVVLELKKKNFGEAIRRIYLRMPLHIIIFLILSWVIVLLTSVLNGSKRTPSLIGIKKCEPLYFILLVGSILSLFSISYLFSIYFYFKRKDEKVLKKKGKENVFVRLYKVLNKKKIKSLNNEKGEKEKESSPEKVTLWTAKKTFITPLIFIMSGLVASLVGIGGGMINNPVFYSLEIPAELVIATSCFLVFFNASSSTFQYIVAGVIQWDYFFVLFFFGFIIALFARTFQSIVEATGRRSFVVIICGISIFFGGIISAVTGIINIASGDETFGFNNPCE